MDAPAPSPAATSEPLEVACYRATPHGAGAVAVIEIVGDVSRALEALCGRDVEPGALRLRSFDRIDEGLVARLAPERAQLMPHGGTRIVERLAEWLAAHGANWIDDPLAARAEFDPLELFPEAQDRVEALALATLARAASPLAVKPLLAQSEAWREHGAQPLTADDLARSERLMRLVDPARVVLVGSPNAGKSTLSNALLGREGSIVSDEPGTTRDAVSARIDLAGLVVEWFDLPGLRETSDQIEREAIRLAQELVRDADLVVALAAPGIPWQDAGRAPDLRVYAKCDEPDAASDPLRAQADLSVSARTGEGLRALAELVRERLVPKADRENARPWRFDARLDERGA
jgi:tRNA modification GTPase